MSKTLMDKKVNRIVKKLNKTLKEDVFGTRFELKQYRKSRFNGIEYYLYEFIDNECPERSGIFDDWLAGIGIIYFHSLHTAMNDFIIQSDFWKKYRTGKAAGKPRQQK